MSQDTINNHAAFIWSVAELLRGDYRQSEFHDFLLSHYGEKVYQGLREDAGAPI